jgi:hypothetical protein
VAAHGEVPALGARLLSTTAAVLPLRRTGSRRHVSGGLRLRLPTGLALVVLVLVLVLVAPGRGISDAAGAQWSPPAALGACPAVGPVRAVFPSSSPAHPTGPGAVVFSAVQGCGGGAGARVARIGADGLPGVPRIPRSAGGRRVAPTGDLAVSSAPHGRVVITGKLPRTGAPTLIQGSASGPFAELTVPAGVGSATPPVLSGAYLGDVGLLSATGPASGGSGEQLHFDVERYFAQSFARETALGAPAGTVRALSLALDYRTDAIAVWTQGGAVLARDMPASGAAQPTQRLGAAGAHVRIQALLSDDNRAIVAWADDRAGVTSVYLDLSATGVRFGRPTLLERFRDPDGLPSPAASPRLIRLSSESVMIAWGGAAQGRWVLRTAPIDLRGLRAVATIVDPGRDVLLADLTPGPLGDALALWTEPQPGADGLPDMTRQAIFASRGFDAAPGRTIFSASEELAPLGPVLEPSVSIDPATDRGLALWLGQGAAVDYSVRPPETVR